MRGDPIRASVLCAKLIPNADAAYLKELGLPQEKRSLGLITADSDDVAYLALDEATKKADVSVAYAKSLYAGAGNASTRLAGEFIGILAGETPEEVRSGLEAAQRFIREGACFYSADEKDEIVYFAHCVSRTGSFLSASAGVNEGAPLAYLIAPPAEALYALDFALKAADVRLALFYGPPTETNFAGGLLTGEQSACKAACEAFAEAVCRVAESPLDY
ncbi:MAG: ethanolamine utilization microcompartment protein EutL [Oscillospiraceae bacterium]|nr:ethanolamine utilization microcompartment protein EutL [Oscillospiraceae bacterium]